MRELFRLVGKIALDGTVEVTKEMEKLNKDAAKLGRTFANIGKDLTKFGMEFTKGFALPVAAAAVAIYKGVDLASDLNEVTSKTTQIFGESAGEIERWAGTADKAFGQSKTQAMDAAATFGIFGQAAGLAGADLTGFSTRFVELASDLASFNNTTPEEAITALGAAFRGESEPIRRYGVLLDDASLRNVAFEMGIISTTKNALTPQQKVLAASELIWRQTAKAQGDFTRTSGELANQERIARAEIANTAAELGAAFLPIAKTLVTFVRENFLPVIRGLAEWFKNLNPNVLNTIVALAALAATFGPVLIVAGKLASFIGLLIPLYTKLTLGQLSLNAAMKANPIGVTITAVYALIAAGTLLYQNWEKIKAAFTGTIQVSDQQIASVKNQRESLEALTAEYQQLTSKTKLSADEKKRVYEISNKIAEIAPSVVTGYDSEGNALIDLNEALRVQVTLKGQELRLRQKQLQDEAKSIEKRNQSLKDEIKFNQEFIAVEESKKSAYEDPMRTEGRQKLIAKTNKLIRENTQEVNANDEKIKALNQEYEEISNLLSGKVPASIDKTTKTTKTQTGATVEQIEAAKKLAEERAKFEEEWSDKLLKETGTRAELLEAEYQDAIAKAEKLGADKTAIEAFYKNKRLELVAEENQAKLDAQAVLDQAIWESQQRDREREEAEAEANRKLYEAKAADIVGYIDAVSTGQKSLMDIIKEQVIALLNAEEIKIIAKIASGIAAAWAEAPFTFGASLGWIPGLFSAQGVALGAIELAKGAIRGLAKGGLVEAQDGGIFANIGEGQEDEIVLPMETGADRLADNLMDRMIGSQMPAPAFAGGGGYGTANIYLEIDGKTFVRAIGRPLTDHIRLSTGNRVM